MEDLVKFICVFGLLVALDIAGGIGRVDGAGECGKSSPDIEAMKLIPCAKAALDDKVVVSDSCCTAVKKLSQNLSCLCAVMLSNTAKSSGANPEVTMTIPKRCNLSLPVGLKCGPYTLP